MFELGMACESRIVEQAAHAVDVTPNVITSPFGDIPLREAVCTAVELDAEMNFPGQPLRARGMKPFSAIEYSAGC